MLAAVTRRCAALAATLAVCLMSPGAAHAQADEGSGFLLTVAARSCPSYDAITANLARNNIQQSLRDLGPNTAYTSGEAINPVKEADHQPECAPVTDWRFTLGTGIGGMIQGSWGSLSFVSNPYSTNLVTQPQTPMLDEQGRPVPGSTIAGATTVELTDAQASGAARSSLWIQGGTVSDPVLDQVYPDTYGFGALRCAIDNVNGDNVEYVQIPGGERHVFCYAYYVVPPPSSGTLVIRKVVHGSPDVAESFVMAGNVSYTPSGTFTLSARDGHPAQQTFFRAETHPGDAPWTVTERTPDGWTLTALTCTHAGASVVTTDRRTGLASIVLAAGDTVTCTYDNTLRPPAGGLLLRKITEGGVGSFRFTVDEVGGDGHATRRITTETAGVPALARPIRLSPGRYRITERRADRRFRLERIVCNGHDTPGLVTIEAGRGVVCTFTNRRPQIGRIDVRETTLGGTATTAFVITPLHSPDHQYVKRATTLEPGVPHPTTGDSTLRIPFDTYVIRQTQVDSTGAGTGTWALVGVHCDGRLVPFTAGRALVRINQDDPRVSCTFTNQLLPTPPDPAPLPPGELPIVPGSADANLTLDKQVDARRARVGEIVGYRLTVTNTGPVTAEHVVVGDQPIAGGQVVGATPSQGTCSAELPLVCRLGTIAPGERATVNVRVQMTAPGRVRNLAAVGSASEEPVVRDNLAIAAAVRVRARPGAGACGASARAHAAC